MGEAKKRLGELGPSRRLRIERTDLMNLIFHFMQPDKEGKLHAIGNRVKRRPFNSAMGQFGVLDAWRGARKEGGTLTPEYIKTLPESVIKEVSVDAIRTVQDLLDQTLDFRDSLNFADFEDMLEAAALGTYKVDEDPAPAEAGTADEETPTLAAVPPETDPEAVEPGAQ